MTYFEFTKRFPDEASAINFIVSGWRGININRYTIN